MGKHKVVIVNENGRSVAGFEALTLSEVYSVCCRDTPDNKIVQSVPDRFPPLSKEGRGIDIILHEEGLIESLPVYCTINGEEFSGPILICASNDEGDWVGLSDEEIELVTKDIVISSSPGPSRLEPVCMVTDWWEF